VKQNEQYQLVIRSLSDRIVEAQAPIRVLDAIKWDDSVRDSFFQKRCKAIPDITPDYYAQRPLGYNPGELRQVFQDIERDITRQLGTFNPVGQIMRRMCREYRMVIRMLEARGSADFGLISQELYGAASDAFHAGDPTLTDLGIALSESLSNIARTEIAREPKTIAAPEAVDIL